MPIVYIERENKTVKVKDLIIKEILKKLNINPTTVIITKNNELLLRMQNYLKKIK
mgnify:CR=1 FL=1